MENLGSKEEKTGEAKKKRWEAILRIIGSEVISTQNDLSRRLREEGFAVTQATVSRDIRLLHLVKTAVPGVGYRYEAVQRPEINPRDKFRSLYHEAVLKVASAENQVVIRCRTGMASGVCAVVDVMDLPGMVGSIAGDDTILVVAENRRAAEHIVQLLWGDGQE